MAGEQPPQAEDPGWAPPVELDGFRVVRQLGRGGMGTVYLGYDDVLERPVALKFLATMDPKVPLRDRLLIEARAIARLQHPNIVGIYRVGEVHGRPYLAYELVAGHSLDELTKPVPWPRALELVLGVARGLAAAHGRDVLHRDIKPANVMLSETGEVKLLDFGLAKLLDGARLDADADAAAAAAVADTGVDDEVEDPGEAITELADELGIDTTLDGGGSLSEGVATRPVTAGAAARGSSSAEASITATGVLLGTPLYMAPELWRGEPATAQSDIYALGLVLYELLTGQLPHQGLRAAEIAHAVQTRDPPSVRTLCPTVPQALADVVDRAIRRRREERFQTAHEVRDALEAIHALYLPFAAAPEAPAGGDDAALITASFARIAPRADAFCSRVYERLFADHPEVRPMFPADLAGQRRKLLGALTAVVDNLSHAERLVPLLEDLGRRHAAYGVTPQSFDAVGAALLGALGDFDDQLGDAGRTAWTRAYARIAQAMQRGLAAERLVTLPGTADSAGSAGAAGIAGVDPGATRYARNGDLGLAYQTLGTGPDLVLITGWLTHLEAGWQWPPLAHLLRSLATLGRLIVFDARGTGLSDAAPGGARLEDRTADLGAVLDAAGAGRAALFGLGEGAAVALAFAAAHPERTRALVLYGATARPTAGDGHPYGPTPAEQDADLERIRTSWGEPLFLERLAPSVARDASFRERWARYLRAAAGPGAAIAHHRAGAALDVRAVLPAVRAPALVLHREGDAAVPIACGRDLAARLPDARFVALPGEDHLPFVGDSGLIVEEVRRFLDISRPAAP